MFIDIDREVLPRSLATLPPLRLQSWDNTRVRVPIEADQQAAVHEGRRLRPVRRPGVWHASLVHRLQGHRQGRRRRRRGGNDPELAG